VIVVFFISLCFLICAGGGYLLQQYYKKWTWVEFVLLLCVWVILSGVGQELCPKRWSEIALPVSMGFSGISIMIFLFFRTSLGSLGVRRFPKEMFLWILGFTILQQIVSVLWVMICVAIYGDLSEQAVVVDFLEASPYERWTFVVLIALIAPIVEEFLVRGFAWDAFSGSHVNKIAITGMIFGCLHVDSPYSVVPLCIFGFLLGYLRYKSDSIWPSVLTHFLNNVIVLANIAWL